MIENNKDKAMKFWQVDSFTEEIFKGNPAAVFIVESELSDQLMKNIAMEMNLSETAFVHLGDKLAIRWFTPAAEVNLCGHATLAAAHVLWEQGMVAENKIEFSSKSGVLGVTKDSYGYTLDFPAQPAEEKPQYYDQIRSMLGCSPIFVGSNGEDCMAVVEDADFLRNFEPPLVEISKLIERGFLLTSRDKSDAYDYIYRAFFPKLNIAEDPVTGSSNTCLAPYWAHQLQRSRLTAFQASSRGGELMLELSETRVLIGGKAVTVLEGELALSAY